MKKRMITESLLALLALVSGSSLLLISACSSNTSYAPVVDAWQQAASKKSQYIVDKGDTIYSIAWAFGLDYRALAAANHLGSPYKIYPGQRLRMVVLPKRTGRVVSSNAAAQYARRPSKEVLADYCAKKKVQVCRATQQRLKAALENKPIPRWIWPVRGRVIEGFSSNLAGNHGINIAGQLGQPIHAAAAGWVVYSGDGIRGYGNLVIIKHNDSYLSAYAFNKRNRVVLGQRVQAGQTIAEMGRNDAGSVMLHFEIRRNGKPVDPAHYVRR